jgi:magnesium transporter
MILRHLLLPDILDLVESGRLNDVREFLAMQPAPEIAELLTALEDKDRVLLFRLLPRHLADEVFSLLELPFQDLVLKTMAQEEVRHVLAGLSPDDRTALFEELPARVPNGLLGLLDAQARKQTLTPPQLPRRQRRPPDDRPLRHGRTRLDRRPGPRAPPPGRHRFETMTMIYIVDEKGRLTDDLRLRKIILAPPETPIAGLLDGHYASLHSLQDREEAVQTFRKYDLYALPVVDSDGVLLGIVTVDDILDVAEEEATEDFHKLATVSPLQISFKDATLGLLFRKRIGWLVGLVVVNIFTGMGIKMFEETIVAVAALVALMPLLIGSGGNAGAQAATLVVRAIATGEIGSGDWWKLLLREIGVSTAIGLAMSGAAFFLGWALGDLRVALVVALSMTTVVIAGSLMGTVLPMLLNKLKLDPATASVPLITSMADILGVLIYFSIANAVLRFVHLPAT